jgi:hypothetical protein
MHTVLCGPDLRETLGRGQLSGHICRVVSILRFKREVQTNVNRMYTTQYVDTTIPTHGNKYALFQSLTVLLPLVMPLPQVFLFHCRGRTLGTPVRGATVEKYSYIVDLQKIRQWNCARRTSSTRQGGEGNHLGEARLGVCSCKHS